MGCESSLQKQKVLNQLFCVWKNCVKHNQPSVMHWVYIYVEVEAIVVSAKFDSGLQACIPSPAVKLQACRCRAGTKLKYQLLCKIWKRLRSMLLPRSCSIVGWSNCFQGVQWSPCCMDCFFPLSICTACIQKGFHGKSPSNQHCYTTMIHVAALKEYLCWRISSHWKPICCSIYRHAPLTLTYPHSNIPTVLHRR